jgi:ABC-type Co2+ transport system permease subunit
VAWLKLIQEQFGVNPWVFAALYVVTLPPGWYGTWRVVGALRRRNQRALLSWAILVGVMVLAPYTYVLIAGRNLPWWFYPVLAGFLALSAWKTADAIRRRVG